MRRIYPDWPAPTTVRAFTTTREEGISQLPYEHFNLALHVNDKPEDVALNRLRLSQECNFMFEPAWLEQTHSTHVVQIKTPTLLRQEGYAGQALSIEADGAWTQLTGQPCVVLTADCLPLLMCDTQGTLVAAIHCGWKGMAAGIIENAVKAIRLQAQGEIMAWLGPAIGPSAFEVGEEVRELFIRHDLSASQAFRASYKPGKWLGDMYQLARQRLHEMGVSAIYGGDLCTYTDAERFYSFRRDGVTGRMATLIWLTL